MNTDEWFGGNPAHDHRHRDPEEWFELVHRTAVDRLDTLYAAQSALEMDPDNALAEDTVGAFCGCVHCIVREVMEAGGPILLFAAMAGDLGELT